VERLAGVLTTLAVRYVDPDAVILFGSVAQGRSRADSDVDLLIVGPFVGSIERRGLEFREAISEFPVQVDPMFLSRQEFVDQAGRPGSFVQTVSRHGRVVYVRRGLDAMFLASGADRAS
jgi:hypothetical protein